MEITPSRGDRKILARNLGEARSALDNLESALSLETWDSEDVQLPLFDLQVALHRILMGIGAAFSAQMATMGGEAVGGGETREDAPDVEPDIIKILKSKGKWPDDETS